MAWLSFLATLLLVITQNAEVSEHSLARTEFINVCNCRACATIAELFWWQQVICVSAFQHHTVGSHLLSVCLADCAFMYLSGALWPNMCAHFAALTHASSCLASTSTSSENQYCAFTRDGQQDCEAIVNSQCRWLFNDIL